MKSLRRRWAVVQHYHDGSGVIRAWGPFESEAAAHEWELPEHMSAYTAFEVVEFVEPFAFGEGE